MTALPPVTFASFWWRVVATHMLTYSIAGLLAFQLADYRHLYSATELRHLMRPTSSPWVAAGPGLQVIRGTVFAIVLWPLSEALIQQGSRLLFALLLGLAILGPAGPAPGSLEGVIFTSLPPWLHLMGLPEVVLQTAAFSFLLIHWCRKPARWKNIAAVVGIILVVLMSTFGVMSAVSASPGPGATSSPSQGRPQRTTLCPPLYLPQSLFLLATPPRPAPP